MKKLLLTLMILLTIISGLPLASTPDGEEYLPVVQGGVTKKVQGKNAYCPCPPSSNQLLASGTLDFNVTTDQTITLAGGTSYAVTDVLIYGATANMTTAADGRIYTAVSRGGSEICETNLLSKLVTASVFLNRPNGGFSFAAAADLNTAVVGNTLYFSLTTPQGSAATVSYKIFGTVIAP